MRLEPIGKIIGGQDGAIYKDTLFRIENDGVMTIYDLDTVIGAKGDTAEPIATTYLDRRDEICPHSNSVCFGNIFFSPEDEFPLLYSNIYNNYAKTEDPMRGVCCVYRVERKESSFTTTLVQLISIGFTEDPTLWKMSEETHGARPYGNFSVDCDRGLYLAFVMREEAEGTRYFSFRLPKVGEGIPHKKYGVDHVILTPEDIIEYFDCEHHIYVQGACCHEGKVYSLEGFTNRPGKPPVLRIIDTLEKKQIAYADLTELGSPIEPELIDFRGNKCYMADVRGNFFEVVLD